MENWGSAGHVVDSSEAPKTGLGLMTTGQTDCADPGLEMTVAVTRLRRKTRVPCSECPPSPWRGLDTIPTTMRREDQSSRRSDRCSRGRLGTWLLECSPERVSVRLPWENRRLGEDFSSLVLAAHAEGRGPVLPETPATANQGVPLWQPAMAAQTTASLGRAQTGGRFIPVERR